MIKWNARRLMVAANALAAVLVILLTGSAAGAQSLSVLPVNIFFPAGQKAATLTITNQGKTETAVQIRAFGWNQQDGNDQQLTGTDAVLMSPPLATIAPGASQVVRLILRQAPADREATYRILVDQIPPAAEPGIVHIVLRLSIPIFVMPDTRAFPHLRFHMENDGDKAFLVGVNDGLVHEVIRDIVLTTSDGRQLKEEASTSPYILAGATRRWPIAGQGSLPLPSEALRLTAHSNAGVIDEQVHFASAQ
jgi:fimbrial chaperone protein